MTILSCSSCDLSDLPKNAFRNCQNLMHIDLSYNNFLTIGKLYSMDVTNLVSFFKSSESIFERNEILRSVCSIDISNNVLSDIDHLNRYCPNLTHLVLSSNHIRNWSDVNRFPLLVDCDISHNSLSSVNRIIIY